MKEQVTQSAKKTRELSLHVPHAYKAQPPKKNCIHLRGALVKKYLKNMKKNGSHSFTKQTKPIEKADVEVKEFILNKSFRWEHLEEEVMKASRELTQVICFKLDASKLAASLKNQRKNSTHTLRNIKQLEDLIEEKRASKKEHEEDPWQLYQPAKPDRDFRVASIHPYNHS